MIARSVPIRHHGTLVGEVDLEYGIPSVGDVVRTKTEQGRMARYRITFIVWDLYQMSLMPSAIYVEKEKVFA